MNDLNTYTHLSSFTHNISKTSHVTTSMLLLQPASMIYRAFMSITYPPRSSHHQGKEQHYHRREPHHDDEEQYHHRGDNILEDAAILPPELRQYLPTMLTLRQYFDMLLRQYLPTFTSLIKYGVLWICIELLHRL